MFTDQKLTSAENEIFAYVTSLAKKMSALKSLLANFCIFILTRHLEQINYHFGLKLPDISCDAFETLLIFFFSKYLSFTFKTLGFMVATCLDNKLLQYFLYFSSLPKKGKV